MRQRHFLPRFTGSAQILGVAVCLLSGIALAQIDHIQAAANLLDQGETSRAESEARLALRSPDTKALALAMLGTIRLQQAKYGESVQFLNQALALNPKLVGARTSLGDAYVFTGEPALARNCFQKVLQIDPGNFNARADLFRLEASQGKFQQSLDVGRPIMPQLLASDEALAILASDYGALGKKDDLSGLVAYWRKLPAASVDSSLDFGGVLLRAGLTNEAAEILDGAEKQLPEHPLSSVALRLGNAFLALGHLEQAEKNAQLALSIAPNCTACYQTLAAIAQRQYNSEKALAYLVTARRQAPDDPEVLFEFGNVCLERNLLDDALAALTKAVELSPENDSYVYALGSANVGHGDLPKALSLFQQLLKKHPNDAGLTYAIGAAYFLQTKYSDAEAALKQSLAARPDQIAAAYYLALTYDAIGDDDRAIPVFRDLIKNHPTHSPSYIKLGSLLVRAHQYEEAKQYLEHGIALDPDSVEAHYQLGLLLRRMGKPAESDAQLAESQKLEAAQRAQKDIRLRLLLPD